MNYLLIIYIPILISIIWAVRNVYLKGDKTDSYILVVCGFTVIVNGVIKHFVYEGYELPILISCSQQILSSLIVPMTYMFFARQAGRELYNDVSIILLAFLTFLLLPNLVIFTDGICSESNMHIQPIGFRSICLISRNGQMEYAISDLIIAMQAIVTTIRIIPMYHKICTYGLELSKDVKIFLGWWLLTVVFIFAASFCSSIRLAEPITNTICHIMFMIVLTSIFYLLGRGFDLRPVLVTKENDVKLKEPVELESFVRQSQDMAKKVRQLIDNNHVHLESSYNADKAIAELGTNRTYFYRMIKTEFKCTFCELINRERTKEVKHLLETTDDSLLIIAEKCGFSDASYMIKVFKHEVGITPNEWRERKGNQAVSKNMVLFNK